MTILIILYIYITFLLTNLLYVVIDYYLLRLEIKNIEDYKVRYYLLNELKHWVYIYFHLMVFYAESDFFKSEHSHIVLLKYRIDKYLKKNYGNE